MVFGTKNMTRKHILLVFVLGLKLRLTAAWDCEGHMVIAEIARRQLQTIASEEKGQLSELTALVGFLGQVTDNHSYDLVDAACWADDFSRNNFTATQDWHFIPKAYNADDSILPHTCAMPEYKEVDPSNGLPENTAPWAIAEMAATTLRCNSAVGGKCGGPHSGRFEVALALRLLLHLVGDIHQPLHCVERYTSANPRGDGAGVHVQVRTSSSSAVTTLHQYWDGGAGLFNSSTAQQSSRGVSRSSVSALADTVMREYPQSHISGVAYHNFSAWSDESYDMAVHASYFQISDDLSAVNDLSELYQRAAAVLVKKRLAIAGYRLAGVLSQYTARQSDSESKLMDYWNRYNLIICAALGALAGLVVGSVVSCCCCGARRKAAAPAADPEPTPLYHPLPQHPVLYPSTLQPQYAPSFAGQPPPAYTAGQPPPAQFAGQPPPAYTGGQPPPAQFAAQGGPARAWEGAQDDCCPPGPQMRQPLLREID